MNSNKEERVCLKTVKHRVISTERVAPLLMTMNLKSNRFSESIQVSVKMDSDLCQIISKVLNFR